MLSHMYVEVRRGGFVALYLNLRLAFLIFVTAVRIQIQESRISISRPYHLEAGLPHRFQSRQYGMLPPIFPTTLYIFA